MFNLVFVNNVPSVKLWKSLGFKIIGVLPKAGRLRDCEELVDAYMFHMDFEHKGN
jgi:RimJ/RimL family protein N-acetyltransferase